MQLQPAFERGRPGGPSAGAILLMVPQFAFLDIGTPKRTVGAVGVTSRSLLLRLVGTALRTTRRAERRLPIGTVARPERGRRLRSGGKRPADHPPGVFLLRDGAQPVYCSPQWRWLAPSPCPNEDGRLVRAGGLPPAAFPPGGLFTISDK